MTDTDLGRAAARAVVRIRANVEAYYSGEVGYEDFGKTAKAIWVEVERDRAVQRRVLATLRRDG